MTWTIEKVKEELPDVNAIINGKVISCWVGGRQCKFAIITHPRTGMKVECSWPAIVRSLNSGGRPIII